MNTKTMRLPPRRISTTTLASSNNNTPKRKERDNNSPHAPLPAKSLKLANQAEPSNQLLAGYLALEFLTKGTLLGQLWDPTTRSAEDPSHPTVEKSPDRRGAEAEPEYEKVKRYVEVADLMKTDGARLAGIVNPTQLARLLQL